MKYYFAIIVGIMTSVLSVARAAPPLRVASVCDRIAVQLDNPATDVRLEIAIIPKSTIIDDAPNRISMEKYASVIVTVNADYDRERVRELIRLLRAASWDRVARPTFYTKTRARFIGPWEVMMEADISTTGSELRIDGVWYRVGSEVIACLLSIFQTSVSAGIESK